MINFPTVVFGFQAATIVVKLSILQGSWALPLHPGSKLYSFDKVDLSFTHETVSGWVNESFDTQD